MLLNEHRNGVVDYLSVFITLHAVGILLLWHNLMFGIIILVWGLLFFLDVFGCVLDGFSDYNCYTHKSESNTKVQKCI